MLSLQVFINGKRKVVALDMRIPPAAWDVKRKCVRPGEFEHHNTLLYQTLMKANQIFLDYRVQELELTPEKFLKEFRSGSARGDFLKYYETEMDRRLHDNVISHSTWKQNKVTLDKLREFMAVIPFSDLTYKLVQKFDVWHLRRLKQKAAKGGWALKNEGINTLRQARKNIRTYVLAALKDGIKFKNPFDHIRVGQITGTRTFLEPDELQRLYALMAQPDLRQGLRDVLQRFLFSCFTGLRISDSKQVHESKIDAHNTLVIIPKKTSRQHQKEVRIPLSPVAVSLITNMQGGAFNIISDVNTNRFLKELAYRAQINKTLSYKVARHTFGTLFMYAGGRLEVLQNLMGHADIRTTMFYVHLANEIKTKREQIELLDGLLNPGQ